MLLVDESSPKAATNKQNNVVLANDSVCGSTIICFCTVIDWPSWLRFLCLLVAWRYSSLLFDLYQNNGPRCPFSGNMQFFRGRSFGWLFFVRLDTSAVAFVPVVGAQPQSAVREKKLDDDNRKHSSLIHH